MTRRRLEYGGVMQSFFATGRQVAQAATRQTAQERMPLAEWAAKRRIIDERPFSLERYPFLAQIYADTNQRIVLKKPAQMGLSEWAVNRALWALDEWGMDILYLLPADDEAYDFSNGRFGPAIEESEYLADLFTDVANVQHKRAGERNFYIRGSNSRSKLKSIPIDFLIVDEYDEMTQKNLPVARRRLDASPYKWEIDLSTPTVPEFGIDARYQDSDQHQWEVHCPACGRWQVPAWPENINLEADPATYWCASCHHPTETFLAWLGRWTAQNPSSNLRGYHLTQMVSPTKTAAEMAEEARKADEDPAIEQEFYNQGLGEAHVAKGGALDDDLLLACRNPEYRDMPSTGRRCSMGVDVGKVLHVRISARDGERKRAMYIGTVPQFEDLDPLMARYDVGCAVIDEKPETRKSMEFCQKFPGRAFAARYDIEDKAELAHWDPDKRIVRLNRTVAMDKVMTRVQTRSLILPAHAQTMPDYFAHMKAPKRVLATNKRTGEQVYRYVESSRPDHFAHAELYDEMAWLRLGTYTPATDLALDLAVGRQENRWRV